MCRIRHENETNLNCVNGERDSLKYGKSNVQHFLTEKDDAGDILIYTYNINFYESKTHWTDRWNHYLLTSHKVDMHWYSALNSIIIFLIFSTSLAFIFTRILKKDINTNNTVKLQ